jgi:hypothetical protein
VSTLSHQERVALVEREGSELPLTQQAELLAISRSSLYSQPRQPSAISDRVQNQGFINVGLDHETAACAVESIRRWWRRSGKALSPDHQERLITADGGSSNGTRNRRWKKKRQELANEEHLTITVTQYPPATSTWNTIEHRLFSFLSLTWRAKPLTSLERVLELISQTTTKEGFAVMAVKESQTDPTGLTVSDDELAALNLSRDSFHGEWNSTIKPQEGRSSSLWKSPKDPR